MSCYQMKMLLPAFENNELTEAEKEAVILHLASCSRCLAALEAIRELHNRLSILPTTSLDSEMTNNIIAKIKRMKKMGEMETIHEEIIIMPADLMDEREAEDSTANEDNKPESTPETGHDLLPGWDFPWP
jgi:hypothetical protein